MAAAAAFPGHNRAVRVAILGPLEVHDDDGAVIAVAGARLRGLIARLALAGGQPVSTGALAEAVWDDDPPADVANALQTLVSRARRALGGAAAVEQSAAGVPAGGQRRTTWTRCASSGSSPRAAVAEALALWRGPALADAGDFAEPFARRLEELRLEATVTLLTREIDAGRAAARAGELEALVAEHPLHERLAGLLMRALAAAGRQADALAAYERCGPGSPTSSASTRARSCRRCTWRCCAARSPRRRPRPRAAPARNLRAQLTSFVGRDGRGRPDPRRRWRATGSSRSSAPAARARRGSPPRSRPGCGTTRTATVDRRHLDGRARAGHRRRRRAAAVLGALGLREARLLPDGSQRIASRDARTRLLDGLADARALLVLDNCEHLIDACAHLADALLARCPRLRIVATSREPLGIAGESLFVVPPLDADPAVRLFADRAAAVSPGFALDARTRPLVTEIVRRLDGLPLAIELAAARLRTLPLAEIAERLADRFRLLTGGSRTALPRHRTLRAVVDWSWELLTPAERLLAERLSVFPAGRDAGRGRRGVRRAARGLAAGEADELLSPWSTSRCCSRSPTGRRLRMLETIREYGAERLAGRGELGELRRRTPRITPRWWPRRRPGCAPATS